MAKQIQIRIRPDGTIESETFQIKGKECLKYIQKVENMLDAKVVDSDFKPDYYDGDSQNMLEHAAVRMEDNYV